jgi:hypothetical protein
MTGRKEKSIIEAKIKWSTHCLERMQQTVYFPGTIKFLEDLKTRREK